jgi:ATP-binding cassette subfamily E protein 1
VRIAVVERALCKPDKCNQECVRACPVNRAGSKCVWVDSELKRAVIDERLCIGARG